MDEQPLISDAFPQLYYTYSVIRYLYK